MESLERYSLSIILSFLQETEGTCLLITKRRYVTQILPIFRCKPSSNPLEDFLTSRVNVDAQQKQKTKTKNRHRFRVIPVQDPTTLLARLNTKRLFRRGQRCWTGLTCQEIAAVEWKRMRQQQQHDDDDTNKAATTRSSWWRPPLELLRFLDDKDSEMKRIQTTLLVSYPRSGNTLLRTLLERVTGYVTGSDTRPDRNLSRELAERHDLVGEGVTDSGSVRIIKSHWPERAGNAVYRARRVVLVVRNPYDAIDSYWNMNATCSHTHTLTAAVYERFREKFEGLVRNEIDVWARFHEYWIRRVADVPVLIVRYEDLIQDTAVAVKRVLHFILRCESLSHYWNSRIHHVTGTASSVEQLGSYQPRSSGGGGGSTRIGKALRKGHLTPELIQYMHETSASYTTDYLVDFGYDRIHHGFPENFNGVDPDTTPATALPAHLLTCADRNGGSVRVNDDGSAALRPRDDPYGRGLQKWRYSVTNHDAEPLPTTDDRS